MVENIAKNSSTIVNPAAVVDTVGRNARGSAVQAKPIAENTGRTISQLSMTRAANGDSRLSTETAEAIKNGAVAPAITKRKEKVSSVNNVKDEIQLSENAQKIFNSLDYETTTSEIAPSIPTYSSASSQIISIESQNISSNQQVNISV